MGRFKEAKLMKSLVIITQLCLVLALAGCTTPIGQEYVYQDSAERRMANVEMVRAYESEQIANGVVRQKTLYAYHFVPDTPIITELGERDLNILAKHYRNEVLPHLTSRNILKEVKVFFDYDDASVRSDAVADLDEAVKLLADNPDADLIITGHADARGSVEYNEVLGSRRAEAIKSYIESHGVSTDRVRIVSRGEMDALASETDVSGMQQDRNAHFMVAELQEYPVNLNVKRGDASEELYSARKKAVRTYLSANGVNTDLITLTDGTPGGAGMPSGQAVVVLVSSYADTSVSTSSSDSVSILSDSE